MNYRPVSLTSICCKVLEHKLWNHCHQILSDAQHGFRKRRSCDTQLVITTDDLTRALDNRKQTDIVILDFSKAFDTVPHTRLINKLTHYGINKHLIKWINSFLTVPYLYVDSGVPQGTVLGPLLFLLYINDLPENLKSTPRLFADDCLLYNTITKDKDSADLQKDLDELTKWQDKWQMRFNASKCYVMHMSAVKTTNPRKYKLCGQTLETVDSHPYLGVHLQNDMKWDTQVSHATSKASRILGLIKRNLYHCSEQLKTTAYTSLVRPLLEYGSTSWLSVHQGSLLTTRPDPEERCVVR